MEHAEEVGFVILPTDHQTAKVMQPGKQTFDLPTAAIAAQFAAVLGARLAAIMLMRSNQLDALLLQFVIQRIAVVSPVADQPLRRRRRETLLESGFDEPSFMWRSACNPHGDRKTMAVRNCQDLGPFAAACWTNSTAPFLAPLKEASINVSARSKSPRASRSSAKVRNSSTSTPSPTHCWKRRWQVWYGGNLVGISDHCAPVRRIHSTPSSTGRVSFHGRPRRLAGVLGSTIDFSNSHCTSVSSMLTGVPVNSTSHNYLLRYVFMR